jgi:hypothetical protein
MTTTTPACFLCNPDAGRREETPWEWSRPRSLCVNHKSNLQLEDGQQLREVLARISPPDSPLEGSLLGWIFNPVSIDAGAGRRTTGWTDFMAGGRAVFEDRFAARSYLEFRAFETARAVDMLHALRRAGAEAVIPPTTKELIALLVLEQKRMPPSARRPHRGPVEGWMDLVRAWNFQLQLAQVRSSRGRLWPESFAELNAWIKECGTELTGPLPGTESTFHRTLGELALRRFPSICGAGDPSRGEP